MASAQFFSLSLVLAVLVPLVLLAVTQIEARMATSSARPLATGTGTSGGLPGDGAGAGINCLRAAGAIAVLLIALATWLISPAPDKARMAAIGLLGSAALGELVLLGPAKLLWPSDPRRSSLAQASLALWGAAALVFSSHDPVLLSYGLCGMLVGSAAIVLPLVLTGHPRGLAASCMLGTWAVSVTAVVWGGRAIGDSGLAWSLTLSSLVLAATFVATWLPGSYAPIGAFGLTALVALPWVFWCPYVPQLDVWAPALGLAAALALVAYLALQDQTKSWGTISSLGLALLAGGLLLLANRLFGMFGVTLAALTLLTAVALPGRAAPVYALVGSVFAGRALLQLFLDRTYLRQYGVDLTHTYSAFGLIIALLLPYGIGRLSSSRGADDAHLVRLILPGGSRDRPRQFGQQLGRGALWGIPLALLLALPLPLGYLVHVDPVATYVGGLLFVGLAFGTEGPRGVGLCGIGLVTGPLLLSAAGLAIVAAKWELVVANASRLSRLEALGLLVVLAALYGLIAAVSLPRARPEVPQSTSP